MNESTSIICERHSIFQRRMKRAMFDASIKEFVRALLSNVIASRGSNRIGELKYIISSEMKKDFRTTQP